MDWLGEIGGLFANVASGGLFGLIGSIIGVGAKYLQERQRQAWAEREMTHELRLLDLEMQRTTAETEQELAIVSQAGAWEGVRSTVAADAAGLAASPSWVNAIRSLFRPVLTGGLVVIVWLIWSDLMAAIETGDGNLLVLFTEAEIKDVLRYIIQAVVFAATTAVVWWFGERAMTPPGWKGR